MGKKQHQLTSMGWLPNYHGAWAMITLPVILGIVYGGFRWIHLLLLVFWWLSYFAFFATSLWLHSRFNNRYLPAVKTYGLLSSLSMLGLFLLVPYVLGWLVLYFPLTVMSAWAAYRRQERSLLSNTLTVIAACLMLPIAYDIGIQGSSVETIVQSSHWRQIWCVTLLVFAYFEGTVLYVKTNIRERKSNNYFIISVLFHGFFTVVAFVLASNNIVSFLHAFVWVGITVRSLLVPLYGRNQHFLSPKQIGLGEFLVSLSVLYSLL